MREKRLIISTKNNGGIITLSSTMMNRKSMRSSRNASISISAKAIICDTHGLGSSQPCRSR